MTDHVGIPDIEAFGEVLRQLQDEATTGALDLTRVADLIDALEAVRKLAGDTVAYLKSNAVTQLETGKPRLIGTKVFASTANRKKRPNHDAIKAKVLVRSLYDDETGLPIEEPRVAAAAAIEACYKLFVAPATAPKTEGLQYIHLSAKEATRWETIGYDLTVTEMGATDDDE